MNENTVNLMSTSYPKIQKPRFFVFFFYPFCYHFFLFLLFFYWISCRNEVQLTPKRQISIFLENERHISLIEQIWGPRQEILCSFRGLSEKSDISHWNWKYQNTLSKPNENKSKELLLEIVMVALKGWNLGNLSPIL